MKIAFIGAGSMGGAMIPHLVRHGHEIAVWNRSRERLQALQNVQLLDLPAQAFQGHEVVITMLADDHAVREVLLDSGVLEHAAPGVVHIVMSTLSPALVEQMQTLHAAHGIGFVVAPVFGVPAVAARAELNILAAGEQSAVARVLPLFDVIGKKTWRLGTDPRHACIAKIAGNLMITMAIESMAEASALTESYGLAAADFLHILTQTLFACPSYQRYGGNIARHSYEPGFKLTLGLKDVNLALAAAAQRTLSLPAANIVHEHMQDAIEAGAGGQDWSILAEFAHRRAGLNQAKG
jgi:3-hydroxyisobutyrate dehydrogenase-like beta-hydroxyacid dehydrogenase